jgi:hypothetical protein
MTWACRVTQCPGSALPAYTALVTWVCRVAQRTGSLVSVLSALDLVRTQPALHFPSLGIGREPVL